MQEYETLLITKPDLAQEETDEIVNSLSELIKKDGEVIEINRWGKQVLAYPLKKHRDAIFTEIVYRSGNKINDELRRSCQVNEQVLRLRVHLRQPETSMSKKIPRSLTMNGEDDERRSEEY